MPRLDESAHVPGIPAVSDIGDKAMVPLKEGVNYAGPIHIDTTGRPPGASSRFRDYIPSVAKRKQILAARGVAIAEPVEPAVHTRHVVRHHGQDYLSGEESKKRRGKQDKEIMAAAREIWDKDANLRKRLKQAKAIVVKATEEQIAQPNDKLRKAIMIMEGPKPITKAEAIAKARAKIYRG